MSNKFLKKILQYVINSAYRFDINTSLGLYNKMPDERFLKKKYYYKMGKKIDLNNPESFNEKLQWLKLNDRKKKYSIMVDKYAVKSYVSERIGEEYIIPTLGVWDRPEQITWDLLPNQFVLKVTHDSGGVIICKEKKSFNKKVAIEKISKSLKHNYYLENREWPYKNVPRKIIAEAYMEDNETKELRDYKFFCFGGIVKFFKIDFDRQVGHRANYYDIRGHLLPFGEVVCPPVIGKKLIMPINLQKMIELSQKLSEGHPFLRVDFYEVNGKVYFGELTFFPATGMGKFTPEEWDKKIGEWVMLPQK